jgi:hypothetical protein
MQIKDYVKPELLVVAVVLYFIGMWLKQSETVKDKYIPLINGLIGVAICAIYVFATVRSVSPMATVIPSVAQALIQADAMRWRRGWHNVISLIDLSSFLYDMKNMTFCFPGYLAKNFRICYNADRLRDITSPRLASKRKPPDGVPGVFYSVLVWWFKP